MVVDTRDSILQAAVKAFAERGLGGGRINLISRAARSNDRMIYYYFGSKEKLFVEVLGKIYRDMWGGRARIWISILKSRKPLLRQVVQFTMDHYLDASGDAHAAQQREPAQGQIRFEIQDDEGALVAGARSDRRWIYRPRRAGQVVFR